MAANVNDLTTLEQVKRQMVVEDKDQRLVQQLITAVSQAVLRRTSRRVLNRILEFTDSIDGTGGEMLFLPDGPITVISSVLVGLTPVSPSPDSVSGGYVVLDNALLARPGMLGIGYGRGDRWPRGKRNIVVHYEAGYSAVSDPPGDPLFNGAPSDLGQAVTDVVVQQYKRKDWVDQASKTIAEGEVLSFRNWEWPPFVENILRAYRRDILV